MKRNSNGALPSLGSLFGLVLMVLLLGSTVIAPPSADAQAHRYRIKISNNSRYDIHRIYMSSAESTRWGRDLLGERILAAYGTFTIIDIVPGEWDIKFVDQDGNACILRNAKVFENLSWGITTDWLLNCQASTVCHCHSGGL